MTVVNNATRVLFKCPCNDVDRVRIWEEVRENSPSELNLMIEE